MTFSTNDSLENTQHPAFSAFALELLKRDGELFVFSRYLANKSYYHLHSEGEWKNFLSTRKAKEALTLFKRPFVEVQRGVVDEAFVQALQAKLSQTPKVDWVLMGREEAGPWSTWVSNEQEVREMLEDERGTDLVILEDQDWFDEAITIHAYVPDEDGTVRPGSY